MNGERGRTAIDFDGECSENLEKRNRSSKKLNDYMLKWALIVWGALNMKNSMASSDI